MKNLLESYSCDDERNIRPFLHFVYYCFVEDENIPDDEKVKVARKSPVLLTAS